MTLASSGAISSASIAAEIGATCVVPNTATRNLSGRAAGAITWPNDFWGQTGGGICAEQSSGSDVGGPTCAIAGMSFGATAWNRRIFVCLEWSCSVNATDTLISSASIGGVTAAVHVHRADNGSSVSSNYGCGIISATVPTGASGTVSVTFNNSTLRTCYATTYRVTGLMSAVAGDTAFAFQEDLGVPSSPTASSTINVGAGGLLFIAGVVSSASGLGALAFTGATERNDAAGLVSDRWGNAMSFNLGSQAGRTVSVAGSSSANAARARMVAASFQLH